MNLSKVAFFSNRVVLSILSMMVSVFLMDCSQGPLGSSWQGGGILGSGGNSSLSAGLSNAYEQSAMTIIQQNCTSCHGSGTGPAGVYDLTDPSHLASSGLIVAGQPDQSTLFIAISSGVMPPTGSLSASDQQVISEWILAANAQPTPAPTPSPVTATPTPTPNQPTPTPAATVSFATLESTIFQAKCVGCHSSGGASGGYAFDSYNGVKAAVNLSNPTASVVYTATNSGSMPQGGSRLTSSQETQILQWIQSGAPNN